MGKGASSCTPSSWFTSTSLTNLSGEVKVWSTAGAEPVQRAWQLRKRSTSSELFKARLVEALTTPFTDQELSLF